MYTLKICQTLDHLNKPWTELATQSLGNAHPERVKTFCFAREALRLSLIEEGFKPEISDLVLQGFHSLGRYPDITLSLSHTKNTGVALTGRKEIFQSLGVDVENNDREVKQAIIQKVAHPLDEKLRNIELWVLKEAAFKCLMNSQQLPLEALMTQIQVTASRWIHAPSGLSGECELRREGSLLLGLAFLKN